MHLADPLVSSWKARLSLGFSFVEKKTILSEKSHDGPLVVQKPFYPEGDAVCHAIVVHPPAGIAGGDELEIRLEVRANAHALLTTPGAGKWYRSAGPWARQRLAFEVAPGACLEWLPQETIVFDGALADMACEVRLRGDARYVGWEILCLGRTGSGERFTRGECRLAGEIRRDGSPLWLERGRIEGGGALLRSPAGLAGRPVSGTFIAAAPEIGAERVAACREVRAAEGEGAVTRLPGVLLARYLGASGACARSYFTQLWRVLRPGLLGREASEPRIWQT